MIAKIVVIVGLIIKTIKKYLKLFKAAYYVLYLNSSHFCVKRKPPKTIIKKNSLQVMVVNIVIRRSKFCGIVKRKYKIFVSTVQLKQPILVSVVKILRISLDRRRYLGFLEKLIPFEICRGNPRTPRLMIFSLFSFFLFSPLFTDKKLALTFIAKNSNIPLIY